MRKPQDSPRVHLGSLGGTIEWPSDREAETTPAKGDGPSPQDDAQPDAASGK